MEEFRVHSSIPKQANVVAFHECMVQQSQTRKNKKVEVLVDTLSKDFVELSKIATSGGYDYNLILICLVRSYCSWTIIF